MTTAPILDRLRRLRTSGTLREDAQAGLALGTVSVPDGLASGLLAGVDPVAGLYGYLYGTAAGALTTNASFMAVQGTGAMAVIVADAGLNARDDPARALFTLSVLTGCVMIAAGMLRLGSALRFVSHSVMVGFITAVGINIVLGQLSTFTGYEAPGANRIIRAVNLLLGIQHVHLPTLAVGLITVALIVGLQRTRLGALGLVVAVVAGSLVAALANDVTVVRDITEIPRGLPFVRLPSLPDVPALLVPAMSLAFVGLVQGAAVSTAYPNGDGAPPDTSRDFLGQGVGNVVAGLFQGMPVGGSMSASSLVVSAGARTRVANVLAAVVMALVVLLLAPVVSHVAMPALAGLLIVVGLGTIRPREVLTVVKAGRVSATVLFVTLALTLVIPLQFAVLVGVGISTILSVIRQSTQLRTVRLETMEDGRTRETAPPAEVPPHEVVVLQAHGSLFFAAAATLSEQLPVVATSSVHSVVILRLRGVEEIGSTLIDVLDGYARTLQAVDSRLMLVTDSPRIVHQLTVTGMLDRLGADNVYLSTEWIGETVRRAALDAEAWVRAAAPDSARREPGETHPRG